MSDDDATMGDVKVIAEPAFGKYRSLVDKFLTVVAALLIIGAVVYSVYSRTVWDFIHYPLYLAIPIGLIGAMGISNGWRESGYPRPFTGLIVLLLMLFAASILGVCLYSIGASLKDAVYWLIAPWLKMSSDSESSPVFSITLFTLMAGFLLFYFRLRVRSLYGLSEASMGLAVAAHRTHEAGVAAVTETGFYLAVLTAGVYLVVRGLDNVHQGFTSSPPDPFAATALKYFSRSQTRAGNGPRV
jgi:hypothetical protein